MKLEWNKKFAGQLHNRWKKGVTFFSMGKEYRVTPNAIRMLLKKYGFSLMLEKVCILPECDKVFRTLNPTQKTCCRKHTKLVCSRRENGNTVTLLPCALPECSNTLWVVHKIGRKPNCESSSKRFCTLNHSDLFWSKERSGIYHKLLKQSDKCEVCNEYVILDEHHEIFHNGKSDKSSKTHLLCPTHHMQIHRGFAEYVDGKYVDLKAKIKRGLLARVKLYDNYFTGIDWKEAK